MINPNISKRVTVLVPQPISRHELDPKILFNGELINVLLRDRDLKPGNRALYLRYSIVFNHYYLSDRK